MAFTAGLIERLRALEEAKAEGTLDLPDGQRLKVTNLHKIFWPKPRLTKGDLFRYHVQVAPWLLPAIADRPLVMKRLPNGVTGKPFFQHRVEDAPRGVRVETVAELRDALTEAFARKTFAIVEAIIDPDDHSPVARKYIGASLRKGRAKT